MLAFGFFEPFTLPLKVTAFGMHTLGASIVFQGHPLAAKLTASYRAVTNDRLVELEPESTQHVVWINIRAIS